MTKLYGAGVFLIGVACVGFVGLMAWGIIADDLKLRRLRKEAEEDEWPDYDQYLKDLEN